MRGNRDNRKDSAALPSAGRRVARRGKIKRRAHEAAGASLKVPHCARELPLAKLPLSVRLKGVLKRCRYKRLGDLDGINEGNLLRIRNCGKKTVSELQELLHRAGQGEFVVKADRKLAVPPGAHELLLTKLPLSVRLERVLEQYGYKRLGELDGIPVRGLLKAKNFGKKKVSELQELLHRAGEGEFAAPADLDLGSTLRDAVAVIDHGLARLSERDRQIFQARLGRNGNQPQTLAAIGVEFQMTRERVRQITRDVIEKLRRSGQRLARALEVIVHECQKRGSQLTTEFFTEGFGDGAARDAAFYVRVLAAIEPSIPVTPSRVSGRVRSSLGSEETDRKLAVPPGAHELPLKELPLSVRLERVLEQCGHKRLGDLDGILVGDLLKVKNFRKKGVSELQELLHRAGEGEFAAPADLDLGSTLRDAVAAIDHGLARLPERDRRIFQARLGRNGSQPQMFAVISVEFQMTRERARQITRDVIEKLRRSGPRLARALEVIVHECQKRGSQLTTEFFTEGFRDGAARDAAFYVRVLAAVEPSIPATRSRVLGRVRSSLGSEV